MSTLTDEELMAAYRAGTVSAFEEIYDRYAKRLFAYFLSHFRERRRAEELMQETLLRVHRGREGYAPGRALAGWIFGIAANLRKDELRLRGRRPGDEGAAPLPDSLVSLLGGIEETERRVDAESAMRVVERLPEIDRDIVIMHTLGGLRFPEVAQATGLSLSAVKSRALRAYQKIAQQMGDPIRLGEAAR